MDIIVGGKIVKTEDAVFDALFENSVVHYYADVLNSVKTGHISFEMLRNLARKADIPYSLFFAPAEVVVANIDRKNRELLKGFSKGTFSMNTRGQVRLADIELIVKDLIRKQQLLKILDKDLQQNSVCGCLRRSRLDLNQQAVMLEQVLGLNLADIRSARKEKAFAYIVEKLEEKNIFVSQSSQGHMPQRIHSKVEFSGMCIKDKKIPFIFLNNKGEYKIDEPAGRRIFTLILMAVCIAKSKFGVSTYSEEVTGERGGLVYRITEEILMPRKIVGTYRVASVEELRNAASFFCVTPSALLTRLRGLHIIDPKMAEELKVILREEFRNRKPTHAFSRSVIRGLQRYNGIRYPAAIMKFVDNGALPRGEARRVLLQNRLSEASLDAFRR